MIGIIALAGLAAGCSQVEDSLNSFQARTRPTAGSAAQRAPAANEQATAPNKLAKRVLVVVNSNSSASGTIGRYYAQKRGIPSAQILTITAPTSEGIQSGTYRSDIEGPVKAALGQPGSKYDYVVLTKGVPIRVDDLSGRSVDSLLAAMYLPEKDPAMAQGEVAGSHRNPYYKSKEPFSAAKYRMHLVTRLDGYTIGSAIRLVDLSLEAKPAKGPFFFDGAANREDPAYKDMQDLLREADKGLSGRGFNSTYEATALFKAPAERLMGYASWGSNDGAFDLGAYRRLKFLPGALAETYVSTSGRTFLPTEGGQSLIADLIQQGVTGVKGYVSEPYTFALAEPPTLFAKYTSGANLAESFYSASKIVRWKDVVIGDPLCAPYAK